MKSIDIENLIKEVEKEQKRRGRWEKIVEKNFHQLKKQWWGKGELNALCR